MNIYIAIWHYFTTNAYRNVTVQTRHHTPFRFAIIYTTSVCRLGISASVYPQFPPPPTATVSLECSWLWTASWLTRTHSPSKHLLIWRIALERITYYLILTLFEQDVHFVIW